MKSSRTELLYFYEELKPVVLAGFENSLFVDETEGVFRSHYDWHSSVHAHWMLLSGSRVVGDEGTLKKIIERLNVDALLVEQKRLFENPQFEFPYGQSWLMLLFSELERAGHMPPEILAFKNETALRIAAWLNECDFLSESENTYHSWLMTYFLLKQSKQADLFIRDFQLDEKFAAVSSLQEPNQPRDFFSSKSLLRILKCQLQGEGTALGFEQALGFENHFEREQIWIEIEKILPIQYSNCHAIGKIITLTWAMGINKKDAFQFSKSFMKKFLERPELWRDDYLLLSHWIPQFLWFGLVLAAGEI